MVFHSWSKCVDHLICKMFFSEYEVINYKYISQTSWSKTTNKNTKIQDVPTEWRCVNTIPVVSIKRMRDMKWILILIENYNNNRKKINKKMNKWINTIWFYLFTFSNKKKLSMETAWVVILFLGYHKILNVIKDQTTIIVIITDLKCILKQQILHVTK